MSDPARGSRTALLVLGMHRSGTSALSGCLALRGVNMGNNLKPGNGKGFFEDIDMTSFNKDLLDLVFGSTWDDPYPLPDATIAPVWYERAVELVEQKFGDSPLFGFKDPRTSVLLPFWRRVLESMGVKLRVVQTYRDPTEVAASLRTRDQMGADRAHVLWAKYILAAEYDSRDLPRCHVRFDDLLTAPEQTLASIESLLSLDFPRSWESAGDEIQAFLTSELRHHSTFKVPAETGDRLPVLRQVFEGLAVLGEKGLEKENPHWRSTLDHLRQEHAFWTLDPSQDWVLPPAPRRIRLQVWSSTTHQRSSSEGTPVEAAEGTWTFEGVTPGTLAWFTVHGSLSTKFTVSLKVGTAKGSLIELNPALLSGGGVLRRSGWWYSQSRTVTLWLNWRPDWVRAQLTLVTASARPGELLQTIRHPESTMSSEQFLLDQLKHLVAPAAKVHWKIPLRQFVKRLLGRKPPMESLEFCFIAEEGVLESQALLLCESIRRFAGRYSRNPITIISPRASKRPSEAFVRKINRWGVRYLPLDLTSPCPEYGPTFRVIASSHFEALSQADTLVVLDSDMFFAREPDFRLAGADVGCRPVDVKGMCTTGREDPADRYWRRLSHLCGVDYEQIPWVTSTVDLKTLKASYNGGMIVARRTAGVFALTEKFLMKSIEAGLTTGRLDGRPIKAGTGLVAPEGGQYWGSSQACLSLAIIKLGLEVKILPPGLNFPLHKWKVAPPSLRTKVKGSLSLVHYHQLAEAVNAKSVFFDKELALPGPVRRWFRRRAGA